MNRKKRNQKGGGSEMGLLEKVSSADTEVEAYDFIRRQLRELGWVVKNPNSNSGGQVWTHNQCLGHPGALC